MQNYKNLFTRDIFFWDYLWNTFYYVLVLVPFVLVISLLFAILLNKQVKGLTAIYRASLFLPCIISTVAVALVWKWLLNSQSGIINGLLRMVGVANPPKWLLDKRWAKLSICIMRIWQMSGYYMVMFLTGLQTISPTLYEAAVIDGATRWQQRRYVSLPALVPLITLFLITAVAGIFSNDFGLFYTIPRNVGLLYETTDVINTYVYRGLQNGSFLQSSAIGLMQSTIGTILLIGTNAIVRKVSPENSMF